MEFHGIYAGLLSSTGDLQGMDQQTLWFIQLAISMEFRWIYHNLP